MVDLLDVWAQVGVDVMGRMRQLASVRQDTTLRQQDHEVHDERAVFPAFILHAAKYSTQGRITSADVARLAGVSQSAVSRVFTDGASASAKTSAKVREAAEMGYRPNRLARSLLTG